ncbi:metallophosphoesterase [Actibacterium lipolyticum]|uniref:Serine/threonine-protein phosphatase 2 n=1 Tax=Actibacterium lipolyticum TaxID=1524263 RepID=A0A238KPT4_9RHOB|nr:metallophosphoesterase [Actibacterium lipolyticum]SMX44748.1 Serine/threonine-protein phosphatase 2 [Actibacterium lipolyticum]
MKVLQRLFGSKHRASRAQIPPANPDQPFVAIGDIHGRDDLLERLMEKINLEFGQDIAIITVGDAIDRGEESAYVLDRLFEMSKDENSRLTSLVGNHEDMMLRFLDYPETHGARWLRFGGLQTLASFGVGDVFENSGPKEMIEARDQLRAALGVAMEEWLRHLPSRWISGNVGVVHAGADPSLPISLQSDETLIWGHPDFGHKPRFDNIWVIHGHTITPEPQIHRGHVAIDTGAYATGRLTAVHVSSEGGFQFLTA